MPPPPTSAWRDPGPLEADSSTRTGLSTKSRSLPKGQMNLGIGRGGETERDQGLDQVNVLGVHLER